MMETGKINARKMKPLLLGAFVLLCGACCFISSCGHEGVMKLEQEQGEGSGDTDSDEEGYNEEAAAELDGNERGTLTQTFQSEEALMSPYASKPAETSDGLTEEGGLGGTVQTEEQTCVEAFVCGAVEKPGVYTLLIGSRVVDAVSAAGGMAEGADTNYVNLAGLVSDGQQIYIPLLSETSGNRDGLLVKMTEPGSKGEEAGDTPVEPVNVNTAGIGELMRLPGVGEKRAADIMAYRDENGGFESIEELMKVKGIKEASFEKMKDYVTIN